MWGVITAARQQLHQHDAGNVVQRERLDERLRPLVAGQVDAVEALEDDSWDTTVGILR